MCRQPLVLPQPILLVLGANVIQINRYTAVEASWKLFPFQRIAEFLLDRVFLLMQKVEECLGTAALDIEFIPYPPVPPLLGYITPFMKPHVSAYCIRQRSVETRLPNHAATA